MNKKSIKFIERLYNVISDYGYCIGIRMVDNHCDWDVSSINTEIKFNLIMPSRTYWYADPILANIRGNQYVFMEAYHIKRKTGCIAVAEIKNGNIVDKPKIIIDDDCHHSFPTIIQYEDDIYMIPDGCARKQTRIYKMGGDVYGWNLYKIFDMGIEIADIVNYEKNGNLYLIGSEPNPSNPFENRLLLFKIIDLNSQDKVHIEEIGINDKEYSYECRNGGEIIVCSSGLYRVIQTAEKGVYGKGITFHKIISIDDNELLENPTNIYIEKDFFCSEKKLFMKKNGIHTYGRLGNVEAIDFNIQYVIFDIHILDNLFRKIFRRLKNIG